MVGKIGIKALLVCAIGLLLLGGVNTASAAPGWHLCDVAWAGCGGDNVIIILINPGFVNTLGSTFPEHSIMAIAPAETANRYLVTALSAISSRRKILVYMEATSFSTIGGLYVIAAYESSLATP